MLEMAKNSLKEIQDYLSDKCKVAKTDEYRNVIITYTDCHATFILQQAEEEQQS